MRRNSQKRRVSVDKMASLAVVSDDELRQRLLGYGQNFPITASNRGILLSKLKRLDEDAKKSTSSRNRRSLLGFSSSDESESERGGSGVDVNNAAAAVPATFSTPTSSGARKTRVRSRASDVHPSSSTRRRSSAVVQPNSSSGGESPCGRSPIDRHASSKVTRSTRSSAAAAAAANAASRRSLSASSPSSSARPSNLDISDSDISDSSISNIPENRDVSEFPRSRRSMYANWGPSTPPSNARGTAQPSPPSSSGLRWSTSPRALNGSHDPVASELLVPPDGINAESAENHTNSSQCVSMILLAVAALFFLIVSVIYLGARHRDLVPYSGIDSGNVNVSPVCNPNSGKTCIVVDIANSLKSTLRNIAGDVECNGRSDNLISRRMPFEEAEHQVTLLGSHRVSIWDVLLLLSKNPLWGVRLLREDGTAVPSNELRHVRWLESAISNVPLLCRLKLAFLNTIFKSAIILGAFLVVVLLGYVFYLFVEWKRKEREEVFALVEKILDVLQDHARACQGDPKTTPYLAIPHVRDMLIPPAARKSGRSVWDMAVRFIQNNESRVRFETQCVAGEDFLVWRWLQPDSRSLSGGMSPGNKSHRIWQGQAFETLDSGMNALPCSPTPCLKVRNMFDPDVEYEDDWPFHIRDAILEKCIEADIVHLRVDSSSNEGCVYIKCKDSATAGKVYRDLHGWWFDGKLVTVKYLRLERYHERFPEAASCFRFLRPNVTVSSMRMRNRSATFASTPSERGESAPKW